MLNLSAQLRFHARTRPRAEALIYGESRLDWSTLEQRVHQLAGGLSARGIGADSIVGLVMKNSSAFIELTYALSHVGAVCLPMNFRLAGEEIAYIANHAGVDMVVADAEFSTVLEGLDRPLVVLDTAAQADPRQALSGVPPVTPHPRAGGDLMRLMYTSGTTDRPKGVTHSYDNFHYKNMEMILSLQLTAQDRLCMVGPLYHVGACDLPGMAVHVMGGTLVVLRDFDAQQVVDTIVHERITGIWLAPVMTSEILALSRDAPPDLTSLRWCIAGGDRTPEARIRDFGNLFAKARYVDAYGMTETVSGDTLMEPGREIDKIGSVGRPVSMVEVEIRDDTGTSLPVGEVGEICMRGPKVTRGYWKDPERTAAAMHTDGFLRSGDMGYLDAEGFLYLTDRKKDMIISGGENIASSELERVIFQMPQVADVAVIAKPDEKWGEVPMAVIVPQAGQSLEMEELNAFCRSHLAGFKCPKDMKLVAALPRNPSGKILKRVLRDEALKDL
ncbi:acyl-CoA synthetase [Salipiger aestuarii]|uniref:3-methylmercaptopropionyl-CoA ligase n=1 Tax=Salipiger aestuarii TaxID=568098 RepID=A0A327XH65_9RHOB|nr:AMP-binding protein [Salipiger aestuarii]KAA8605010.1 acyl-CoA synthetase [Salipiger aestuarii]KAB2533480.1 acyl-CoA synthetase [Salipiger aestuarii]RAK08193.1 acyl-CoA synthetase (AMP-forming)/AMP-acid ligase II [Salipiger aestuarii]